MNPERTISLDDFITRFQRLRDSIGRVVLGQEAVVEDLLIAVLARGHVLIEGAPGLGKTQLVKAFASATDLQFGRIQFTPDLMPADVTGTNVFIDHGRKTRFEFKPGPMFANVLQTDEINRAAQRSHSGRLEGIQWRTVTSSWKRYSVPER